MGLSITGQWDRSLGLYICNALPASSPGSSSLMCFVYCCLLVLRQSFVAQAGLDLTLRVAQAGLRLTSVLLSFLGVGIKGISHYTQLWMACVFACV